MNKILYRNDVFETIHETNVIKPKRVFKRLHNLKIIKQLNQYDKHDVDIEFRILMIFKFQLLYGLIEIPYKRIYHYSYDWFIGFEDGTETRYAEYVVDDYKKALKRCELLKKKFKQRLTKNSPLKNVKATNQQN